MYFLFVVLLALLAPFSECIISNRRTAIHREQKFPKFPFFKELRENVVVQILFGSTAFLLVTSIIFISWLCVEISRRNKRTEDNATPLSDLPTQADTTNVSLNMMDNKLHLPDILNLLDTSTADAIQFLSTFNEDFRNRNQFLTRAIEQDILKKLPMMLAKSLDDSQKRIVLNAMFNIIENSAIGCARVVNDPVCMSAMLAATDSPNFEMLSNCARITKELTREHYPDHTIHARRTAVVQSGLFARLFNLIANHNLDLGTHIDASASILDCIEKTSIAPERIAEIIPLMASTNSKTFEFRLPFLLHYLCLITTKLLVRDKNYEQLFIKEEGLQVFLETIRVRAYDADLQLLAELFKIVSDTATGASDVNESLLAVANSNGWSVTIHFTRKCLKEWNSFKDWMNLWRATTLTHMLADRSECREKLLASGHSDILYENSAGILAHAAKALDPKITSMKDPNILQVVMHCCWTLKLVGVDPRVRNGINASAERIINAIAKIVELGEHTFENTFEAMISIQFQAVHCEQGVKAVDRHFDTLFVQQQKLTTKMHNMGLRTFKPDMKTIVNKVNEYVNAREKEKTKEEEERKKFEKNNY